MSHYLTDTITMSFTFFCIFLVIYHHLGYPFLLKKISQTMPLKPTLNRGRQYTKSKRDNQLASIAIVIPAYNEAQWIAEKIRNIASLDYPENRLQVIIGCDGCNDQTVELAHAVAKEVECAHLNIQIINFSNNSGKVAVLNALLSDLTCDLVALTDTSALISIDALLIANQRFKDPTLGVLNSHYQLLSSESEGEQAYWDYQTKIKVGESMLGAMMGAHGALYFFRQGQFSPLPVDTINDDFILPMTIVAAGFRSDHEPCIHALELETSNHAQDVHRRRRIAAGNLQQLFRLKKLLLPRYKGIAFCFLSGKALRVMMPLIMIMALIGCLLLASNHPLFMLLSCLQIFAYSLAAWQLNFPLKRTNKICTLLAYLVSGHLSGLIGCTRYLLRLDKGAWTKVNK